MMKKLVVILSMLFVFALFISTPVFADYGSSSSVVGPSGPPVCQNQIPQTPVLYQPWHPLFSFASKLGEVKLHWTQANMADHYIIAFGLSAGNYIYGAPNVGSGNSTEYTVSSLVPGQKYYFAVMAGNGCMPSKFSNEEIGVASRGQNSGTSTYVPQVNGDGYYVLGGSAFQPVNNIVNRDTGVSF